LGYGKTFLTVEEFVNYKLACNWTKNMIINFIYCFNLFLPWIDILLAMKGRALLLKETGFFSLCV
jgi:hypothetical protein